MPARRSQLVDIAHLATYHCSSYKAGHHFEQTLGPASLSSTKAPYWQTESSSLPHTLGIRFAAARAIRQIQLHLDASLDDSYTPRQIVIRAGSYKGDLLDVMSATVDDGQGWLVWDLCALNEGQPVIASCIDVVIMANLQSGRDSRLRGVRVMQ